jgi:hypothetical protein
MTLFIIPVIDWSLFIVSSVSDISHATFRELDVHRLQLTIMPVFPLLIPRLMATVRTKRETFWTQGLQANHWIIGATLE